MGFSWGAISWWKVLAVHKVQVSLAHGASSHGLSIFAKYIPGKIWAILGRAHYASVEGFSLTQASLISLKAQIIVIWLGLILGTIPVVIMQGFSTLVLISSGVIILMTLFILSEKAHNLFLFLFAKAFKKKVEIPAISRRELLNISVYYGLYWILLVAAFYLFVRSFFINASIYAGFAFPWAATLGMLAIVIPAGLGVREGVMIGYLSLIGVPVKLATTLSVLARLWTILGEAFIFVLALVIARKAKAQLLKKRGA
jgi:uncharacterized membrane protein YbhN (UPF0104 family)